MDGLVPLAYLLDDAQLIAQGEEVGGVDARTTSGRTAHIGPRKNEDWWPNMVMLKVLTQYAEATGDKRVVPLMDRYLPYHNANAAARPLDKWAVYRWGDEVLSLVWTLQPYRRTRGCSNWRISCTRKATTGKPTSPISRSARRCAKKIPDSRTHVVNNAMALKTSAVWCADLGRAFGP